MSVLVRNNKAYSRLVVGWLAEVLALSSSGKLAATYRRHCVAAAQW